jgi:hypothetical protein
MEKRRKQVRHLILLPRSSEGRDELTARSALQKRQQELLRQREMAKEAAAYKVSVCSCIRLAPGLTLTPACPHAVQLKYEQANREKARAARAARLERKRAVFEKVRAALLAKQRKPEPRLSRDSPPPQPRLSRDSPPPRPRLPPASDARPAVVALSFRLRDPDDLYALLDLSPLDFRTVPSNDVVRDARIDQLRVWHPDREGGDHERAQRINEAFERLATGALPHACRPPRSGAGPTDDSCASALQRTFGRPIRPGRCDADPTRPLMTDAPGTSDRCLLVVPELIRSTRSSRRQRHLRLVPTAVLSHQCAALLPAWLPRGLSLGPWARGRLDGPTRSLALTIKDKLHSRLAARR